MKKILSATILVMVSLVAHAQLNVQFRANLPYPNQDLANIGGYVDNLGNEYALVGTDSGLSIVNVTNPSNPVISFSVPEINNHSSQSIWREVKTWQHYAYVTTENGGGLQIVDLQDLPNSIQYKQWTGDGAIAGQLNSIHSLHIDAGYVYLNGSNLFNGACVIASLLDPWNPTFVSNDPGVYVHDSFVRNDTLWTANVYDGYFSVIDINDKTNPFLINTQVTPSQFTHNCWLNDASTVLFTTDEVNDSYLTSYDVSDVFNIKELDRIQLTPGSGSIIHNTHTLNDYEIISWYKDGIAIVDVAKPDNMVVVGTYDTYPQGSGGGFDGCWGVYPFLPSGNLVCSDISNGLFVLTPTYVRGCYLEGLVTDSLTTNPIFGVKIEILNTPITEQNKFSGIYKTGYAVAGTYDVVFSKPGYKTRMISGVSLQNGILTNLNVALLPLTPFSITGQVTDANSGLPIADAKIQFINIQYNDTAVTDAGGNFTINGFFESNDYALSIGKWGYYSYCGTNLLVDNSHSTFNINLSKGYYDDFTLNLGWTTGGSSFNVWERGVPIGTLDGSVYANPNVDVAGDCRDLCFVTDNGGGGPWDHDVDGGTAVLISPYFDLTQYVNPVLNYSRWFYNGGFTNGNPNDTMIITLSNGITTTELERMNPNTTGNGIWLAKSFNVTSFITPTANMRLVISTADLQPFNILEGGFDKFEITEAVGINEISKPSLSLNAMPNPFSNSIQIQYHLTSDSQTGILSINDIAGREIEKHIISSRDGNIETGSNWPAGIYFAHITDESGSSKTIRLNKGK